MIHFTERPIIRTAPAPLFKLSGLVRGSGLKVVLTGEGADEVFAGYDIFKENRVRRFCARQPGSRIRPHLFRKLYRLPGLRQRSAEYLASFFGANGHSSTIHSIRTVRASTARRRRSSSSRAICAPASGITTRPGRWPHVCRKPSRAGTRCIRRNIWEARFLLPGYPLQPGRPDGVGHGIEGVSLPRSSALVEFAAGVAPPR